MEPTSLRAELRQAPTAFTTSVAIQNRKAFYGARENRPTSLTVTPRTSTSRIVCVTSTGSRSGLGIGGSRPYFSRSGGSGKWRHPSDGRMGRDQAFQDADAESEFMYEGEAMFRTEGRFYRPSSVVVRNLGVLAASVAREMKTGLQKRTSPSTSSDTDQNEQSVFSQEHDDQVPFRVLDVCSATGVRAMRYLREAGATFAWANDAQTQAEDVLRDNLETDVYNGRARVTIGTLESVFEQFLNPEAKRNTKATDTTQNPHASTTADGIEKESSEKASNISAGEKFQLVDLDLFGPCTIDDVRQALSAVDPNGGLLFVSSTDSVSAAGHNASAAERAWQAKVHSHPAVNEQFLRLIMGVCARAANSLNLDAKPVFSFFHSTSSTARIMIRVKPSKTAGMTQKARNADKPTLGYISHCRKCGQNASYSMNDMEVGKGVCSACGNNEEATSEPLVVSGPLWIGRLHNVDFCKRMRTVALSRAKEARIPYRGGGYGMDAGYSNEPPSQYEQFLPDAHTRMLEYHRTQKAKAVAWTETHRVLDSMVQEAELPPLYYSLKDIGRRLGCSIPPRQLLLDELSHRGYRSSGTHCKTKSFKTDAPFADVLDAGRTAAGTVTAMRQAAVRRKADAKGFASTGGVDDARLSLRSKKGRTSGADRETNHKSDVNLDLFDE